ncbi:universal stress protein, partial [Klebsiella pneumoniae]|nr:universal stress protein [Klebsiella pneumoniae]
GMHQSTISPDSVEDDPAYEEALKICRQGTQLAENLGLVGRAHLVESATTISSAIVDAAHELDVDVIVTGTRALTGFRAWWTNSTAE